ncbi:MAG TPA: YkgJ family cysteine cluster protein [Nitrosopumilaceae archaeon]|nr:YkgJ family cysteine cluster protein [Nitrosopumilaceae archaeon]
MKPSFSKLCDSCTHQNCCTDSSVPLVFESDFKRLEKIGKTDDRYLHIRDVKGKKIKAINKKNNSTQCVFWDDEKKNCSIYEHRPFDCRAYPFDIILIDNKYHWIVYSCNPESNWKWTESYLEMFEKDESFKEIRKNMKIFSDNTELILPNEEKKRPYTILREVR